MLQKFTICGPYNGLTSAYNIKITIDTSLILKDLAWYKTSKRKIMEGIL